MGFHASQGGGPLVLATLFAMGAPSAVETFEVGQTAAIVASPSREAMEPLRRPPAASQVRPLLSVMAREAARQLEHHDDDVRRAWLIGPPPGPPTKQWLAADPRRWPRLFPDTTTCTLSRDPITGRHWFGQ